MEESAMVGGGGRPRASDARGRATSGGEVRAARGGGRPQRVMIGALIYRFLANLNV